MREMLKDWQIRAKLYECEKHLSHMNLVGHFLRGSKKVDNDIKCAILMGKIKGFKIALGELNE